MTGLYVAATLAWAMLPGALIYALFLREFLDDRLGTDRPDLVLSRDLAFSGLCGAVALSVAGLAVFSVTPGALDRTVVLATAGALTAIGLLCTARSRARERLRAFFRTRRALAGAARGATVLFFVALVAWGTIQFFLLKYEETSQHPWMWQPCRHEVGLLMSQLNETDAFISRHPTHGEADTFVLPAGWEKVQFLHRASQAQRLLVLSNVAISIALWGKWGLVFAPLLWTLLLSLLMYQLASLVTRRRPVALAVAALSWHAANEMLMYMNNENVMAATANAGLLFLGLVLLGLPRQAEPGGSRVPAPAAIWVLVGLFFGAAYGYRPISVFFVFAMIYLVRNAPRREVDPATPRLRRVTHGRLLMLGALLGAAPTLYQIARLIYLPVPIFHPRVFMNLVPNRLGALEVSVPFWPLNFPFTESIVRFAWNAYPSYVMTYLYLVWAWGVLAFALVMAGAVLLSRRSPEAFRFLAWFVGFYLALFAFLEQLIPHQYSYLAQLFPAFVPPLALATDALFERASRTKAILLAAGVAVGVAGTLSVIPRMSVPVDERRSMMGEYHRRDPRGFLFQFPFDARAALPPAPRVEPNAGFGRYLDHVLEDGRPATGPLRSNHAYVFNPMIVAFGGRFERELELLPLGDGETLSVALDLQQLVTTTIVMRLDTAPGAPIHVTIGLDPEPDDEDGEVVPPNLDLDLRTDASVDRPGGRSPQVYTLFLIGSSHVRPDDMRVTVDGEPLAGVRFVGSADGGWLTNLPEAELPTLEVGFEVRGDTVEGEGLTIFVYDLDMPVGPSRERPFKQFAWWDASPGVKTFTWPAAVGDDWIFVNTVFPGDPEPQQKMLYSGPISGLVRVDGRWPVADLDRTAPEPTYDNHPVFYWVDGERTPRAVPVTGP